MSKASETGSSFMQGVIAKLPESLRSQAETIFKAAEAEEALAVIGTGALAQPEINRRLDEARQQADQAAARLTELNDWYAANLAALQEYKAILPEYQTLKANGNPNPAPKPPADPGDMRKTALEVVNEAGREYVSVSAWIAAKAVEHLHRFAEPLDAMALVANPKLGRPIPGQPDRVYSLNDAYQEAYGEKVKGHLQAAEDARINKLVEDRLAEERKKITHQPFPLGSDAILPIDVVNDPNQPKHNLDTATALYEELTRARG